MLLNFSYSLGSVFSPFLYLIFSFILFKKIEVSWTSSCWFSVYFFILLSYLRVKVWFDALGRCCSKVFILFHVYVGPEKYVGMLVSWEGSSLNGKAAWGSLLYWGPISRPWVQERSSSLLVAFPLSPTVLAQAVPWNTAPHFSSPSSSQGCSLSLYRYDLCDFFFSFALISYSD